MIKFEVTLPVGSDAGEPTEGVSSTRAIVRTATFTRMPGTIANHSVGVVETGTAYRVLGGGP